jgi:hypothetical protein
MQKQRKRLEIKGFFAKKSKNTLAKFIKPCYTMLANNRKEFIYEQNRSR